MRGEFTLVSPPSQRICSHFSPTHRHTLKKVFCWLPHLAGSTLPDVLVFHNSDMASSPTSFSFFFLLQFEQNSSATGQRTDDLILMWISQHF